MGGARKHKRRKRLEGRQRAAKGVDAARAGHRPVCRDVGARVERGVDGMRNDGGRNQEQCQYGEDGGEGERVERAQERERSDNETAK